VTQEQVESQLSAMFDGELPAAECELLSRRIDRDERLRARWARYALIGAAMRSEPVATAGRGFARAVSAAIDADEGAEADGSVIVGAGRAVMGVAAMRTGRTLRSSVLAASIVAAVAGLSITMLRNAAPVPHVAAVSSGATAPLMASAGAASVAVATPAGFGPVPVAARSFAPVSNGEPRSYVTPVNVGNMGGVGLQTELADFIVAHSEYSTPLMRRNLLSALVSNEDAAAEESANHVSAARAGRTDAIPATSIAGR
jgi:sigma-E factor negative regulatory protein RseA